MNIYVVFDVKANHVEFVLPQPNNVSALRSFEQGCRDSKTVLHLYPEDFELRLVASIDEASGEVTPVPLQLIARGIDFRPESKEG